MRRDGKTCARSAWKARGPGWDGGRLQGGRLMIHVEHGVGDTLQFIRLIPELLKREPGAKLVLLCDPTLETLLQRCLAPYATVASTVQRGSFDVWCPLLSLPRVLGITPENIPAESAVSRGQPARGQAVARTAGGGLQPPPGRAGVSGQRGSSARPLPFHDAGRARAAQRGAGGDVLRVAEGGSRPPDAGQPERAPDRCHGGVAQFRRHGGLHRQPGPDRLGRYGGGASRRGDGKAGRGPCCPSFPTGAGNSDATPARGIRRCGYSARRNSGRNGATSSRGSRRPWRICGPAPGYRATSVPAKADSGGVMAADTPPAAPKGAARPLAASCRRWLLSDQHGTGEHHGAAAQETTHHQQHPWWQVVCLTGVRLLFHPRLTSPASPRSPPGHSRLSPRWCSFCLTLFGATCSPCTGASPRRGPRGEGQHRHARTPPALVGR